MSSQDGIETPGTGQGAPPPVNGDTARAEKLGSTTCVHRIVTSKEHISVGVGGQAAPLKQPESAMRIEYSSSIGPLPAVLTNRRNMVSSIGADVARGRGKLEAPGRQPTPGNLPDTGDAVGPRPRSITPLIPCLRLLTL